MVVSGAYRKGKALSRLPVDAHGMLEGLPAGNPRWRDHPPGIRFRTGVRFRADARENAMKKLVSSLGRIAVILLLLAGLSVCTMTDQGAGAPPPDALSFDQLLEGLDGLQGTATQSPSAPGMSVFRLPTGSLLSSADLSSYINAIKRDLAAYIYSCTGGRPYLVVPTRVPLVGSTSGLAWVPFTWGQSRSFPIISYQHGTQVYRECAPSRFNANPLAILSSPDLTGALQNYVECIVGGLMASAGYIVVMPDYQGFGDSSAGHPYVHRFLGDSVRDIVVWAKRFFKNRTVSANQKLYLTGYSEGGYATMAGARSLQQPAVSVPVTAIVPCDGPYSLSEVMLGQMLSGAEVEVPSYLLYTASGYYAAEPQRMPSVVTTLLLPPWFLAVGPDGLFNGTHTNAEVGYAVPPTTIPKDMLTVGAYGDLVGKTGLVYQLLTESDAWQGWVPAAPLVFVHCRDDDVVPYANAVKAQEFYFKTFGKLVPIVDVPAIPFIASLMGSNHIAAYPTAMLAAFKIIRTVAP
jgi:pimeloyl-ACP methyl ester carboxylesterase